MVFAREGAKVLAVDLAGEGLAMTAAMINQAGGIASSLISDAGNDDDVAKFIDNCLETYGGLDVIYANAGVSGGRVPLAEQTTEMWQEILRVNLIGPFLAIKHAAPIMRAQGKGSIICTASVAALRANAGGSPYAASKAGVVSLVQTAANELFASGIRVNAICPGLIETGMTKSTFDRARARGTEGKIGQLNPTRRNGNPEEIANMALFLASDEASFVNGQAYAVDGGLSSTHPFVQKAWVVSPPVRCG